MTLKNVHQYYNNQISAKILVRFTQKLCYIRLSESYVHCSIISMTFDNHGCSYELMIPIYSFGINDSIALH